jgi:RHS repeat-associated protein
VDLQTYGEDTSTQFLPITNTVATVAWDGRDAYGRLVGGSCQGDVTVSYVFTNADYGGITGGPELSMEFPDLFGNDGNATAFAGRHDGTVGVGVTFQQLFTYPDLRALGFGGWSPTVLHRLDPLAGILYYGDGRISTLPQAALRGDFLQFGIAPLQRVVAAAPDGSVYFDGSFTDTNGAIENFIFRLLPGGTFTTITASIYTAGAVQPSGINWSPVDGQSVTKVSLGAVDLTAMCVGPDGSLYVTDSYCIARLTPDGIWHVILGLNASFPPVLQPDGTPATNSYVTSGGRVAMAAGPDSSVYFTTTWGPLNGTNYSMIRKIAPNGNLYTVFGAPGAPISSESSPIYWNTLYGTSAYAAPYGGGPIQAIAVGSDGTVYVSPGQSEDGGGMFRISTGGIILPFLTVGPETGAGAGYNPTDTNYTAQILGDEGKLATEVTSGADPAQTMAVGPDGSVYFTPDGFIVWRVDPDGILERVAGRYGYTTYGIPDLPSAGGDPLNTYIYEVYALAVTPNNTLVLNRGNSSTLPNILLYPGRSSQQGLIETVTTLNIPSADGSEIYVFDQTGRHFGTLDSLTGAAKWTFAYDTNSLVVTMTDIAGNVTRIQRNGAGLPTAIIGPYGQTTTLGVDANGFLSTVSNPANETTSLASTSGGLLSSITGPLGDTYSVSYDSLGRVTQVRDPLGGGWTDTVTNVGFLPDLSYEVNVAGANSVGDTLFRQLTLTPNGSTTETYYTGTNNVAQTVLTPNGDETFSYSDGAVTYVGMGADPRFGHQVLQPAFESHAYPNNLLYQKSIQHTAALATNGDPLSLTGLTNITTINGNTYTTTYNPSNRTVTLVSPSGRTNSAVSDALGRIIHVASPGQPVQDRVYDSFGRLAAVTGSSSAGTAQATLSYDALGELSTVTDPLGRSNTLSYDAAGRVKQITLADGSVAGITQDSESHLTALVPPGRPAHNFQYNAVGSLIKYSPPLVGTDESVSYQYDTERDLTQVSFPDGQVMTLTHGLAGRLEQATLGAGPTLTYQYGANFGSGFFMPTNIISSTGDSMQFGYVGSILTSVSWSGSISGQVSVQLNSDLLPSSESVNGGPPVAYTYDSDQLLTQAGALAFTRDPVTGFATGTSLGGVTDQRQFDDRGNLTNYAASANGASIWSVSLSHDLIGRLTNRVETTGGVTTTNGYTYDIAGRLQQVWRNGSLATTYTYDTNGNRLSRNSETATYDAQDRVQSYFGTTFGWSPNGSLQTSTTGGQTTTFTYDVRGALTTVALPGGSNIDYLIDAGGRRIGKSVAGSLVQGFLYDSLRVVAELDGTSQIVSQFVYASKPDVPDYMVKGTNIYRIISDERESVRLVVNVADGSVAEQIDYDEFGRVQSDTAPGFQPFGFAGGLYDNDTGLVRFGFRDFSPLTGQWTARDPIGFQPGQLSLYCYAGNDPVNSIDPIGLGPWKKLFLSGLAIVGGVLVLTVAVPALAATSPFWTSYLAVSGVLGIGLGSANAALALAKPNAESAPTSIGAIGALAAGNSPVAKAGGAILDLGTTLYTGGLIPSGIQNIQMANAAAVQINDTAAFNAAYNANQALKIQESSHEGLNVVEAGAKVYETNEAVQEGEGGGGAEGGGGGGGGE